MEKFEKHLNASKGESCIVRLYDVRHENMEEELNYCELCIGEFKNNQGVKIHFMKVHQPRILECEKNGHNFDYNDFCTHCGLRADLVEDVDTGGADSF